MPSKRKNGGYIFKEEELQLENQLTTQIGSQSYPVKNKMMSETMIDYHKSRSESQIKTIPTTMLLLDNYDNDNNDASSSYNNDIIHSYCVRDHNQLDENDIMYNTMQKEVDEAADDDPSMAYERRLLRMLSETMGVSNNEDDDDDELLRDEFEREDLREELNETGLPLYNEVPNYFQDYKLPDYISAEFDIWKENIAPCIEAILNPPPMPGKGANVPIFEGSTKSVQEFSEGCDQLRQELGILSNEDLFYNKILGFCNGLFPKFKHNLPVKQFERNGETFYHATVKDYLRCDDTLLSGVFKYQICIGGCTIFVGKYANAKHCPVCNKPRFFPCKQCRRRSDDVCTHPIEARKPLKILRYKAITPVLIKLLKQPGFLTVLNCENIDRVNGQLRDNPDCQNYIDAHKFLKRQFIMKYPYAEDRKQIVFVPFLFSVGYDGVQLHKHKCSTFKPLF